MRISDWSSDVCSSDLVLEQSPDTPDGFSAVLLQQVDGNGVPVGEKVLAIRGTDGRQFKILISVEPQPAVSCHATAIVHGRPTTSQEIGRASCRESGGQYVRIQVVDVYLKKK